MSRGWTAISPQKRNLLIDAFAQGATQRIACGVARVSPRSLGRYLERGRAELEEWVEECEARTEAGVPVSELPKRTDFADFYLNVSYATARVDLDALKELRDHDPGSKRPWQNIAWFLERRQQGEFALKDASVRRLEVTGEGGGPVKTESRGVELVGVLQILKDAGALPELEPGPDRPRQLVPAARDVLAEPGASEPAADGVPPS